MEIKENVFDLMYESLAGSSLKNLSRLVLQNKLRLDIGEAEPPTYTTC